MQVEEISAPRVTVRRPSDQSPYLPAYYGRLLIVAMFNAGLQVWNIRDPYNPRRVAY
jgi:hypothetical protein